VNVVDSGPLFSNEHVVVVTGGGTGIGFEIAKAFDAAGAVVVITGRRREVLEEAASRISHRVRPIPFDVTRVEEADKWLRMVTEITGPVRTLINNAGMHQKKESLSVGESDFDAVLLVNLRAAFALSRAAAGILVEKKLSGDIQFISSMAALVGIPRVAAYTAAKSALAGLSRQLAVEWGEKGIRVNTIAPGFIRTVMSSKALDNDPERKQKVLERTAMKRLGEPEEVGALSVFLSSPGASFITGAHIPVDGGFSIGF
jgi:NAD(P)-dependent dehydrogenase (short-subunit alcohol dehydrogenase family)